MAQEAKMISQADVVESLAAEGLVSVSEGAGQPQKNMKLSKFADSLGSAVPLQQTTEQVTMTGLYARTSDGKMVELTKESVASVMVGLMGYPAGTRQANLVDDCNAISNNGYYPFSVKPNNAPSNAGPGAVLAYYSSSMKIQYYFNDVDASAHIRRKWYDNEWSAWSRIDNFGANTKEELASMVAELMPFQRVESFPRINGAEWYLFGTIVNDSAAIFLYADITFVNTLPALYAVSVFNYDSENIGVKCRLVVGETGGKYTPNLKYKLEDGVVKFWARGSAASSSQLLVLTGAFIYKGLAENPPTDAIQPSMDN